MRGVCTVTLDAWNANTTLAINVTAASAAAPAGARLWSMRSSEPLRVRMSSTAVQPIANSMSATSPHAHSIR